MMSYILLNIFSANKFDIMFRRPILLCLLNCTTDTIQVTAGRVLARPGKRNPLKQSGYFMCHQVWQEELCILRTMCISVFCRALNRTSDYVPTQAKPSQAKPSQAKPSQAKPSQSSNWGRRLARSASRRPPVC